MAFAISQSSTLPYSYGDGNTVALDDAVEAGDFLYLWYFGHGYGSAPSLLTSVSDNVNGASWTILDNSGSVQLDGSFYMAAAFAYLQDSQAAPDGLTVTVNATSGQAYYAAELFDLQGAAASGAIVGHAMNTATALSGSDLTSPAVDDSNSGDFVIGCCAGYGYGAQITAGTGATLDLSYNASNVGCGAAAHLTAGSASGANSVALVDPNESSDGSLVIAETVIIAAGGSGPGPVNPPGILAPLLTSGMLLG